jgi:predicted nuclease of predicted toxin-antitoxin system
VKFKLDENLPLACRDLLIQLGHDADTVHMEGLCGVSDKDLYQLCLRLSRNLLTLDLDFANPLRFPAHSDFGIIILRPHRPIQVEIRSLLFAMLPELGRRPLNGKLWIVEPGKIRIHDPQVQRD